MLLVGQRRHHLSRPATDALSPLFLARVHPLLEKTVSQLLEELPDRSGVVASTERRSARPPCGSVLTSTGFAR